MNPVLVEVTRGSEVESFHRGAAVIVDRSGRVVEAWGAIDRSVYPRSAVKPLQAVPLIATGAARGFQVTAAEVALACASHNGERLHTEAVAAWLKRLGCGVGNLECGAHVPWDRAAWEDLIRTGRPASPLHNNCSGKHAGFLTICRHMGFPLQGYTLLDHPVQAMVRDALSPLTGCPLHDAPRGVDGCGIPVYAIPLRGLATAMSRLAAGAGLDGATAGALEKIRKSMIAHPYLVAGRERSCTELINALAPEVVIKTGAEGVYCAAVVGRGLGIALKIDDGATRASEVALTGILRRVNVIDDSTFIRLRRRLEPDIETAAGGKAGAVRATPVLLGNAA